MKQLDLFLEQMKEQAIEYYTECKIKYDKMLEDVSKQATSEYGLTEEEKLAQVINPETPRSTRYKKNYTTGGYEAINRYYKKRSSQMHDEASKWLEDTLSQSLQYEVRYKGLENFKVWIKEAMDKDFENRRKNIIKRVEKKGGKIIDAIELYYGVDNGLNGYIKCENKVVEIRTIYAGGYNIQCLHYRVLIK